MFLMETRRCHRQMLRFIFYRLSEGMEHEIASLSCNAASAGNRLNQPASTSISSNMLIRLPHTNAERY